MTAADRSAFADVFARVARTFNRKLDASVASDYFTALEAVPFDEIEDAAATLVKSSRYFPKPVEWLEAAQRSRKPKRFEKFTPPVIAADGRTETTYHCHWCKDTGWRPGCGCELGRLDLLWKCPAHPYQRHGITYPEPMKPCACRHSNPTWQANHQTAYVAAEERP
jgi:hypothetical protein